MCQYEVRIISNLPAFFQICHTGSRTKAICRLILIRFRKIRPVLFQVGIETAITRVTKAIELINLLAVHIILIACNSKEVIVNTRADNFFVNGSVTDALFFVCILHIILIQNLFNLVRGGLVALLHETHQRYRCEHLCEDYHNQHDQKVIQITVK